MTIDNFLPKTSQYAMGSIAIILISIIYFRYNEVSPNTIIGIVVAIIICAIINQKYSNSLENEEHLQEEKYKYLYPKSQIIENYREIVDLLFSIQDWYEYNKQSFEELIQEIENFIETYESIQLDNSLIDQLYSKLETYKMNILNMLHSLIITIPVSKSITDKHVTAMENMEEILNEYLSKVKKLELAYKQTNGLNINSHPSSLYEKSYNKHYNIESGAPDNNFNSFDFFY